MAASASVDVKSSEFRLGSGAAGVGSAFSGAGGVAVSVSDEERLEAGGCSDAGESGLGRDDDDDEAAFWVDLPALDAKVRVGREAVYCRAGRTDT
jgi:hypothetical protein